MAANEILNFCQINTGTNLLTQSAYLATTDRTQGNTQFTIAQSNLMNKALAQTAAVSSGVAQFLANNQPVDITDQLLTTDMATAVNYAIANYIRQNYALKFTSTGTANALIITTSPVYPTIIQGTEIIVVANATNTGATTIRIDGGAIVNINVQAYNGVRPLQPGHIASGGLYCLVYNGTVWILTNPSLKALGFIGASVVKSTTQAIPGTGVETRIDFSTLPTYDTNSFFNPITNQMTAPFSGYYEFSQLTAFNSTNSTSTGVGVSINLTTGGLIPLGYSPQDSTGTFSAVMQGNFSTFMNAGNIAFLSARTFTGSAARTLTSSYFQVKYLGS